MPAFDFSGKSRFQEIQMRLSHTLAVSAIAVSALSTSAVAGGLQTTIVEPIDVIVEPQETRSSWGIILPIAAVALLIALAGSNGGGDE
jgi:hypothetical protein